MSTFGSLFSGIDGLGLGLEWAGWECRWQVEWSEWCQHNLEHHWPGLPRYGDVTAARFLGTWPRAGMTRNGIAYQRRPLVPFTSGTESGSWPTPDATVFNLTADPEKHGNGNGAGTPLAMAVRMPDRWPTPRASEAAHSGRRSTHHGGQTGLAEAVNSRPWPTPRATDGSHGGRVTPRKSREGGNLIEAVSARSHWPTPTARDWKDGSSIGNTPVNALLGRAVSPTPESGSLNPTWVEWLMGFPLGWTDCEHLATRSSRNSRSGSDGGSSKPSKRRSR